MEREHLGRRGCVRKAWDAEECAWCLGRGGWTRRGGAGQRGEEGFWGAAHGTPGMAILERALIHFARFFSPSCLFLAWQRGGLSRREESVQRLS